MLNREIYKKDPSEQKLLNEGVAKVSDEATEDSLKVLEYELQTFVCEGQYESGMRRILETFLSSIDQPEQAAWWVSGFFGSGKSHFIKMLRALWVDLELPSGATARGKVSLPQSVEDLFKELSAAAKRHGGLHAISGTLGAGAKGSVRLALLGLLFKSVGLPERYPVARFLMWLRSKALEEGVRAKVESLGGDWEEELDNFHVADLLFQAMADVMPNSYSSPAAAAEALNNQFPKAADVSKEEMLSAIRSAIADDGNLPLTLIALDEVQQFIGDDPELSIEVQLLIEALSSEFSGKVLVVGTGQTAITGTPALAKLQGRFPHRIELSDADVEKVVRQVVLEKKPSCVPKIEKVMESNVGEISRHLSGTSFGHRQDDVKVFARDYPVLPVRWRFWEKVLRVIDKTGTDSQLRNQLSMIHSAIQTNLDKEVGNVIPADYLYFDVADRLLQSATLPRIVHEKTMEWREEGGTRALEARACGTVFLLNKLKEADEESGIKADVESIADLLVTDLSDGSSKLRSDLPGILDKSELLIKVGEEYRIQTEESAVWNSRFQEEVSRLNSEAHQIELVRSEKFRSAFGSKASKSSIAQGQSKEPRDISYVFDSELQESDKNRITVWVRPGWTTDEKSVKSEAQALGNESPVISVFVPRRNSDELRSKLIDLKAAESTLNAKGIPNSPEGIEARSAIETIKANAEAKVRELLNEMLSDARVFKAGGSEVAGTSLEDRILSAANSSAQRLYPKFDMADSTGWATVYSKARTGAPDALKHVEYEGEPSNHPVCKTVISIVGSGKKGSDIRTELEGPDRGWSKDAIDGAVQVLLSAGILLASDESGKAIAHNELERKAIGKTTFKLESVNLTAASRIEIRKLFAKLDVKAKPGEEQASAQVFLDRLEELAHSAGGDPPAPSRPSTEFLNELRLSSGNEQLQKLFESSEDLKKKIKEWKDLKNAIEDRKPEWQVLEELAAELEQIEGSETLRKQISEIKSNRMLLSDPDPVKSSTSEAAELLRSELKSLDEAFKEAWERGGKRLKGDDCYSSLSHDQKIALRQKNQLVEAFRPEIKYGNTQEIVNTLRVIGISALRDRIAAMPGRFEAVLLEAAKLAEPEVQTVEFRKSILRTDEDVEEWLEEARAAILEKLEIGPVIT